jgi:hypothetical protein
MTDALDDLEKSSKARLDRLVGLIESNGLEESGLDGIYDGHRGADMLAHLHAWHLLLIGWIEGDAAGEEVVLPAPGHTWDDLGPLNDVLYERYKDLSYDEAKALTFESREHVFEILRALPAEVLAETQGHPWSPDPLLKLANLNTAHHYYWFIGRLEAPPPVSETQPSRSE